MSGSALFEMEEVPHDPQVCRMDRGHIRYPGDLHGIPDVIRVREVASRFTPCFPGTFDLDNIDILTDPGPSAFQTYQEDEKIEDDTYHRQLDGRRIMGDNDHLGIDNCRDSMKIPKVLFLNRTI